MATVPAPGVQPGANNLETTIMSPHRSPATDREPTSLGRTHMEVFETMQTFGRPLTLRRIAQYTRLPDPDLWSALEELVEFGLDARLNTIIESYVVRSADPYYC